MMFGFLKRRKDPELVSLKPQILPLSAIIGIDDAGILYRDEQGTTWNISYFEAYKGWCKSKNVKRSKPKYICDRRRSDGTFIFYTDPQVKYPQIIFRADKGQEALWYEIKNRIFQCGFASFDWD